MILPSILAKSSGGVLVVSPSTSLREQVRHNLYDQRWPVQEATGGADALLKLETGNCQLLYLDRRLPDLDAEELIAIIKRRFPGIAVVMVDSDSGPTLSQLDPILDARCASRALTASENLMGTATHFDSRSQAKPMSRVQLMNARLPLHSRSSPMSIELSSVLREAASRSVAVK